MVFAEIAVADRPEGGSVPTESPHDASMNPNRKTNPSIAAIPLMFFIIHFSPIFIKQFSRIII